MRLIITRPKADAELLVPRLEALGHQAILCPMMKIKQRSPAALPDVKLQAICASSANGLDAQLEWSLLTALPFFAVGPQSAVAARQRGFQSIQVADGGNLNSLTALIATKMSPDKGALLYLSGADVSGDLAGQLHAHGITVARLVVYDALAIPHENLAAEVAAADGVLLYSPRAARLWTKAAQGLDMHALRHFCLSPNVAAQLPQSPLISVAKTPDDDGMMELLDQKAEAE